MQLSEVKNISDSLNPDLIEQIGLIGKTARALAHELKTPLTSIKMNIEMLDDECLQPENKKRSLILLKREVGRLSEIVESYLHIAGEQDLQLQAADLHYLIADAVASFKSLFEKHQIRCTYDIPEVKLQVDKKKIDSVLLTLLSNAAEAIGENGSVTITSEVNNELKKISVFIADTGCGIADTEKIFTPFYTTKPAGNGIGLILAAEIIRKHGGDLKLISSEPGRTIFEISFLIF